MALDTERLDRDIARIWERVEEELCTVLYKHELEPSNLAFQESVNRWLGDDTYEAFIEDYEE
jgi:hypothetical protein